MQPAPKVSRQCNRTSRLDGDEMRFHVMQHSSNAARDGPIRRWARISGN
jgi:adenylylsulfate kinase-like enzyme